MGVSNNVIIYSLIILSLFLIDYSLGNGFIEISQRVFCKVACYIRKVVKEETKNAAIAGKDILPMNIPIMLIELILLSFTLKFLNNLKNSRSKDKIDELLQNSKDALQTANEFLEKWRLRRIKWDTPVDLSYLDEEPQELKPLELEVPLLHMAIVDALVRAKLRVSQDYIDLVYDDSRIDVVTSTDSFLGFRTVDNTRMQLERGDAGDAGDAVNLKDSTILSVSSLLDEDLESISEVQEDNNCLNQELKSLDDESRNFEFSNRYLWDVIEEDVNSSED